MSNQFDFSQMMKPFLEQNPLHKNMPQMPNVDVAEFSKILQENSQVLNSAGQMFFESAQSIMQRFSDSAQKNSSELFNSVKDSLSASDMEQAAKCQQQYLQNSMSYNMKNAKEVMEIAAKSSLEMFDVISNNMAKNMEQTNKMHKADANLAKNHVKKV